ncbi:MAG: zinc-dependent metalloprotease [Saprospiraceae bacterium]|nr:zinc-dependent metalloprotease [Saprospiraceae bacterium]
MIILAFIVFGAFTALSQTTLFSIINQPSSLSDAQAKVVNHEINTPRIGNVRFVKYASLNSIQENGKIKVAIPEINNGIPLIFEVQNAIFQDPQHYSILSSNSSGYLNLYFTPEGIGGTIDLINRLFLLTPLGSGKALLTEKDLAQRSETICGNDIRELPQIVSDFCENEDCGATTLDVLLLITPEANAWLEANWSTYSAWFLFVESHNINLAFTKSDIPEKVVRVAPGVSIDPVAAGEFTWSTDQYVDDRIEADLSSIIQSDTVQYLKSLYKADIVVVLTNNNYTGLSSIGGSSTIFGLASSLDPFSTDKFCIVQVANIDPSRYTMAHEIAHQFGCLHSIPLTPGCPHGKNMANEKNTIMANSAPDYSRIPHFSNPDISFGGETTGDVDTRNNAQQIRTAFCESANINPDPQFAVNFSKSPIGPICCVGEAYTFKSIVIQGDCLDPFGMFSNSTCGAYPYQYEWRLSSSADFQNSQIIGTTVNITFTVQSCPFYLRLTVTSSNGLVATSTKLFTCASAAVCQRSSIEESVFNFLATPNPATDEINIIGHNIGDVIDIQCFNLQGVHIPILFYKSPETGIITIRELGAVVPGLYLFKIIKHNQVNEVIKVVIQQ